MHEANLFSEEYELIKEKYEKLVMRFLTETTKPTCFLRAVADEAEIAYNKENGAYIQQIRTYDEDVVIIPLIDILNGKI